MNTIPRAAMFLSLDEVNIAVDALATTFHKVIITDVDRAQKICDLIDRLIITAGIIEEVA